MPYASGAEEGCRSLPSLRRNMRAARRSATSRSIGWTSKELRSILGSTESGSVSVTERRRNVAFEGILPSVLPYHTRIRAQWQSQRARIRKQTSMEACGGMAKEDSGCSGSLSSEMTGAYKSCHSSSCTSAGKRPRCRIASRAEGCQLSSNSKRTKFTGTALVLHKRTRTRVSWPCWSTSADGPSSGNDARMRGSFGRIRHVNGSARCGSSALTSSVSFAGRVWTTCWTSTAAGRAARPTWRGRLSFMAAILGGTNKSHDSAPHRRTCRPRICSVPVSSGISGRRSVWTARGGTST